VIAVIILENVDIQIIAIVVIEVEEEGDILLSK